MPEKEHSLYSQPCGMRQQWHNFLYFKYMW